MESSTLEAAGMDIKFNGTADISFALTKIFDLITSTMQKDVSNYLNEAIQKTIFPQINAIIKGERGFYYFDDLEFNYTATEQPIYSSNGLVLVMKGDVHIAGHETPFKPQNVIPSDIDLESGQIQVFISDYVLNSTILTLY